MCSQVLFYIPSRNQPEPVNLTDNVQSRDDGLPHATDSLPYRSESLPYVSDDEPFAHLVDKTYNDRDLHEWEPAPPVHSDPNEPGYMGI